MSTSSAPSILWQPSTANEPQGKQRAPRRQTRFWACSRLSGFPFRSLLLRGRCAGSTLDLARSLPSFTPWRPAPVYHSTPPHPPFEAALLVLEQTLLKFPPCLLAPCRVWVSLFLFVKPSAFGPSVLLLLSCVFVVDPVLSFFPSPTPSSYLHTRLRSPESLVFGRVLKPLSLLFADKPCAVFRFFVPSRQCRPPVLLGSVCFCFESFVLQPLRDSLAIRAVSTKEPLLFA